MQLDPDNHINKLCAQGMQLEGEGKPTDAAKAFQQAWDEATTDTEKLIAAHYVARHQNSVADKLKWDETALALALTIEDPGIKGMYPSLYLNVAKCYEDMNEFDKAMFHYELAFKFAANLPDDGYGNMIRAGIIKGIDRVSRRLL